MVAYMAIADSWLVDKRLDILARGMAFYKVDGLRHGEQVPESNMYYYVIREL